MLRIVLSDEYVTRHVTMMSTMGERQKRLYLGSMALDLGYGGISAIAFYFAVNRKTVARGAKELNSGEKFTPGDRNRAPGAGRPSIAVTHAKAVKEAGMDTELEDIRKVVDIIVEKSSYGDPMTNHKWINATVKSVADEVFSLTGRKYSHSSIKKLIRLNGYSLQKNQKFDQVGKKHPLRDEQYQHIQELKKTFLDAGDPVISIDTKAKEKLGDFIRPGKEYRKTHDPRRVLDHDFAFKFNEIEPNNPLIPQSLMNHKAIVIPYGVYCVNNNEGFVTLGIDADTSEFAANAITAWWENKGKSEFPNSKRILILTDGGGSNRSSGWLFKIALQQFADDTDLDVYVCHYAPGKSKWNPIEHRLWSQVSHSWTAKTLSSLEVVKGYIEHTSTQTGLTVSCIIDYGTYMTEKEKNEAKKNNEPIQGIDNCVTLQSEVLIERWGKAGTALQQWNYSIRPHNSDQKWHDYGMKLPLAS